MDKRIEEILDYSLLIAQAYLLIRLTISKNPYFKTPFFYFFILTGTTHKQRIFEEIFLGVLGCLSVIGFIICVRISIPGDRALIYKFGYVKSYMNFFKSCKWFQLINVFGVMGSTIAKLYIAAHRFAVLRSVHLMENVRFLIHSTIRNFLLDVEFSTDSWFNWNFNIFLLRSMHLSAFL